MSTASQPHSNGQNGATAYAFGPTDSGSGPSGPSAPASPEVLGSLNGLPPVSYPSHNEEIIKHLYEAGFQNGHYADTILQVHQNTYRLHAIILSRSPYLAHLMSAFPLAGGQRVIYAQVDREPEVTTEGFAVALGYLYSAISINLIRPENARGVLAAGCVLGGMDELCEYAYDVCRQSISVHNIEEWLRFLEALPGAPESGPSSGVSTPVSPTPAASPALPPHTSVFGPYEQRLRDDIFHFFVVTLPTVLGVQAGAPRDGTTPPPSSSNGRDSLLQIFATVSFELFKSAVESPAFQIGSDQARFKFAKDAIELRKRGVARGTGAEETVVLAFGGGNMSAVHVTRKTMRKRQLWKVQS